MKFDAEIIGTEGDYSLVAWEGRRFPGLLVQGDSLSILLDTLEESISELREGNVDDGMFALEAALAAVRSMIGSYERLMAYSGHPLPYAPRGNG
ncbi:DUF6959 family protein [Nocardia bhagyanarayanae]|uniref:DUF6959 family protein n=1 Tax=Nocardia bhagyanarayanae TaxID=1215925 RepID=UPI001152AA02|nr:hypothetical protein [Nocardia bhagyanarayanae]